MEVIKFKEDLKPVLEKHNAIVGVDLSGSVGNLEFNFVAFSDSVKEDHHILCPCTSYISAVDLET